MAGGYRPRLVSWEEAPQPVREVLEDVAAALRSTWAPEPFLALAVWPGLLPAAWAELRPNLTTRFFEESADRLRLKATEDAAALSAKGLPGAPTPAEWHPPEELRRQVAGYHYVYPKALLAAAALGETLRGAHFGVGPATTEELAEIPLGAPPGMPPLAPPREEELAPEARALLSRISLALPAPELPAIFSALARWPEALQDVWDFLGAARGLNAYGPKVTELKEFARRQAHHLPYVLALSPEKLIGMGLRPPEVAAAIEYFEAVLPEAVMLSAALQVIFRGHLAARSSPFPVPEPRL